MVSQLRAFSNFIFEFPSLSIEVIDYFKSGNRATRRNVMWTCLWIVVVLKLKGGDIYYYSPALPVSYTHLDVYKRQVWKWKSQVKTTPLIFPTVYNLMEIFHVTIFENKIINSHQIKSPTTKFIKPTKVCNADTCTRIHMQDVFINYVCSP